MPGGRPTKYDPSMCEDARAFLAEGLSKEALAGQLGISKDTLYRWVKEHRQFSDAIKDGETAGQLVWERLGLEAARGNVPGFASTPWAMTMKNRFGYRDKVEHTGEDGGALIVKVVRHADD